MWRKAESGKFFAFLPAHDRCDTTDKYQLLMRINAILLADMPISANDYIWFIYQYILMIDSINMTSIS